MNEQTIQWKHSAPQAEDIAALVQEKRVHSRIYTDQVIFDLEIERIFGKAWI